MMENINQPSIATAPSRDLSDLPPGRFATTAWFEHQGYSRQSLSYLASVGRLESPAHGVYRTPGAPLKWQYVVASLQSVHDEPDAAYLVPHVGGLSALLHQGYGHYIPMGTIETIKLYWPGVLPAWVRNLKLLDGKTLASRGDAVFSKVRISLDAQGRFVPWLPTDDSTRAPLSESGLAERGLGWHVMGYEDMPLLYAVPERAIMEMLNDVPMQESVYHAYVIMQGLTMLRPKRVSALLRACESVKVRRLFLALASRCQHQWFDVLDLAGVDLGRGKRALFPGGKLDAKYLITLPADLDDHAR